MPGSMWQNPETLGREQTIDTTAENLNRIPNFQYSQNRATNLSVQNSAKTTRRMKNAALEHHGPKS